MHDRLYGRALAARASAERRGHVAPDSANRERFGADETGYMRAMGLTREETDIISRRDWRLASLRATSI
jgi:hypothetical protein